MKKSKSDLCLFTVIVLLLFFGVTYASEVTVFSGKKFVRTTSAPNIYTENFKAEPGEAWLVIRNGREDQEIKDQNRVRSGMITLNGIILFSHNDFKHQTFIMETPVSLLKENTLRVELESIPDSFISIDIMQTIPDPVVDLLASDFQVDTRYCPGYINLTLRLTNSGEAEIPSGAHIAFYTGNSSEEENLIGTGNSTIPLSAGEFEDLTFRWENPSSGRMTLRARIDDDGTGTGMHAEVDEDNNTVAVDVLLCEEVHPGDSWISGRIIDAVNGSVLSGVQTLLQADDNGTPGTVLASLITDSEGNYLFSGLAAGSYFVSASHPGYIDNQEVLIVEDNVQLTDQDLVLSPVLDDNEIRIILTWNSYPADLEAHLTEPSESGCRYHCYYYNKSIPTANLDLDDRDGYGPETITIRDKVKGRYRYYVHDFTNRFANSRWLAISGAEVKVYSGNREPLVFTVPNNYGNVWHVFDLDGETGEIIPVHTMSRQSEPGRIDYPTITSSPPRNAYWNTPYSYQVHATDPDNDTLAYSLDQAPQGMTIDPTTGLIEWTPAGYLSGWYNATVKVDDGRCGEASQSFNVYVNSQPTAQFSVTPCSGINPDGEITLTWKTTLAETVMIDPEIGEVAASGSLTIPSPDQPTVYTLTAFNDAALTKRSIPQNPYASFYFSPYRINAGSSTTLHWTPYCSTESIIDHDIGQITSSGSLLLTPTETTTYNLSVTNAALSRNYSATVYIVPPPPPPPPSATFTIAPTCNMTPGEPLTLSWTTHNATEITISPDIGIVESTGTRLVYPMAAGNYVLRATGDGGSVTRTVSFPVSPGLSFYASPAYGIDLGDSVTLHWSSSCADIVTMNQGIGEVDADGSLTVTPESLPITYTLTASNERGSRVRSVSLYQIRPSGTFSANPAVLKVGDSTTLTWTSNRATSCTITPDIGPVELNGSITVTPTKPTSYTLTMDGPGGTYYRTVHTGFVSPIADLKASSMTIDEGQSAQLTWIFANATYCYIDQGIGEIELGGEVTVAPLTTTTYTMTATGPGGTATDRLTINVIPANRPPAVSLSASDTIILRGDSTVLSWDSNYTEALVIEPNIGEVAGTGSMTVTPAATTSYAATATGQGGTSTARVTVTVLQPSPAMNLNAAPPDIIIGESALLTWASSYADRITFNQGIGEVPLQGSLAVTPDATTTYTATAVGPGGTITKNVTVSVSHPSPTVLFNASPLSITLGDSTVLTWDTTNTESVIISPDIGAVEPTGSLPVTPSEDTLYTMTATGPGGTITEQVAVTVSYPEPRASLAADPTTVSSGGTSILTWSTQYAQSCSIEPDIGSVECSGTTAATPLQDTTYTLNAEGPGGTTTAQASIIVTAVSPLTLTITSPVEGESLSRRDIQVVGTVSHAEGLETGVTVNGVVALVDKGRFVANHVPLQEGENTLTARAVDMNGQQKESTLSLTIPAADRYIRLYSGAETGLVPFETTLRFDANFALPTPPTFSYTGPGTVEFVQGTEPDTWNIKVTEHGIYSFTVEAVDDSGEDYSDEVAVFAMDRTELDNLLQSKWFGMKTALTGGNMEEGLYYFLKRSQDKYRRIFSALASEMTAMAADMNPIEIIYYEDGIAKYRINRVHDINGTPVTITYYIYFTRDFDGLFKIYKF